MILLQCHCFILPLCLVGGNRQTVNAMEVRMRTRVSTALKESMIERMTSISLPQLPSTPYPHPNPNPLPSPTSISTGLKPNPNPNPNPTSNGSTFLTSTATSIAPFSPMQSPISVPYSAQNSWTNGQSASYVPDSAYSTAVSSAASAKSLPENYRIMFHVITQDHKQPDLIWNEQTRLELRTSLESVGTPT